MYRIGDGPFNMTSICSMATLTIARARSQFGVWDVTMLDLSS